MSKSDIDISMTIAASKIKVTEEKFRRAGDAVRRFGVVANQISREIRQYEIDEANANTMKHMRGRDV